MRSGTIQQDLRNFATRLLEECGGVVEWSPDEATGAAIVPPEAAAVLPFDGEEFPVTEQADGQGLCVSLATDFLDVSGTLLDANVPRSGGFHVEERYLKGGNLQQAVDRAYTWLNARVKVRGSRPTRIEYHRWQLFVSLRSEDTWESTFAVTLNSVSLLEVDLPETLELVDLRPESAPEMPPQDTTARAMQIARQRIPELAGEFIGRMDGRLARDRRRLQDYYAALLQEAENPPRRSSSPPPAPEEIESRRRAVQLELRRKLTELQERYTMDALLKPIVLTRTTLPVLAVDLNVQRKRAERVHTVYWNSLRKEFEPLPCSRCGGGTLSAAFTNEQVAALCPTCTRKPAEVKQH